MSEKSSDAQVLALGFYAKLALVILIAVAAAEVAPEVVNAVLILILIGLVLGHWGQFEGLARVLGSVK